MRVSELATRGDKLFGTHYTWIQYHTENKWLGRPKGPKVVREKFIPTFQAFPGFPVLPSDTYVV